MPPTLHVLDACSLLNLVASRRFEEIAVSLPLRFITPEQAASEVRYVRRGGGGADAKNLEGIDLTALQTAGILTVCRLETTVELTTFVDLALEMDDGEAAACALVVHRGGILVTDDLKARRVIERRCPGVVLLTTAEVFKAWSDAGNPDARELARALRDVEERARFRPGPRDPLYGWWESARQG